MGAASGNIAHSLAGLYAPALLAPGAETGHGRGAIWAWSYHMPSPSSAFDAGPVSPLRIAPLLPLGQRPPSSTSQLPAIHLK
jgi:hypothetical protein